MAALSPLCCSSILCSSAPSSSSIAAIRSDSPSCSHSRFLGLPSASSRSSARLLVAPLAGEFARPWNCRIGGRAVRLKAGRGAAVVCVQQEQEQQQQQLPAKLQEIVKLFEAVPDSKQKYEQLLYYAKQLKPLAKEFCTSENKVVGCVSQVWVKPTLTEDNRVYFEADSDSLLTKGLAALLVEGLSGATVSEILKVTPDFIQMLGLKQSLTPSRSNGFLNMLKLMQKKSLNMYMEAEAAKAGSGNSVRQVSSQASAAVNTNTQVAKQMDSGRSFSSSAAPEQVSKKDSIQKKLQEALAPTLLEVDDVSHQHAGHAGVHKGATETHFNVKVVSDKFAGTSLIKRHRLVYELLDEEIKNGVHALSLVTKTPTEIGK
ncbi:BolA family transcriptional regulator, general stress-responsive regulator [Marchantia polymorpha subsp. ruderalis]|uniref:Fe-S metabolism associated domain-containing protein n=2 Tax=Marchantia polymorpha TaxID=3197 RepID=A0AAF6C0Z7_MARPO|nr:hypothetical protein MARPO_0102s0027 [Marchantia polymorpha]BBN17931.1 hypothetical protein Mp_7g18130 [Marchantia polymorpha subsp. ruderalis]|eukprot:PTQ32159.1 hypothetical protein MARPO_0102s0027 [Marchantia polymorpha]